MVRPAKYSAESINLFDDEIFKTIDILKFEPGTKKCSNYLEERAPGSNLGLLELLEAYTSVTKDLSGFGLEDFAPHAPIDSCKDFFRGSAPD